MPVRSVNVTEKNIRPLPARVVTANGGASTNVLPDIATDPEMKTQEVCARYIQNLTGAVLYAAYGQDCDNVNNYHIQIADKQVLDVSNVGSRIAVYSAVGGPVATTVLVRKDLVAGPQIFQAAATPP